jgi:hypothetical protein
MASPVRPDDELRPRPDRGVNPDPFMDPVTNGHDQPSEPHIENRPVARSNSGTTLLITAIIVVLAAIAYFMFAGSNTRTGMGEQTPAPTAPTQTAPTQPSQPATPPATQQAPQ